MQRGWEPQHLDTNSNHAPEEPGLADNETEDNQAIDPTAHLSAECLIDSESPCIICYSAQYPNSHAGAAVSEGLQTNHSEF